MLSFGQHIFDMLSLKLLVGSNVGVIIGVLSLFKVVSILPHGTLLSLFFSQDLLEVLGFFQQLRSEILHHHASSQQYSIYTVGTHEGLGSVESSRLHVMLLLRNITQPCHTVLQIASTMLSHNLKVDYIIEDRLEKLQTPAICSLEPHTLLYCKMRYRFINPTDWSAAQ